MMESKEHLKFILIILKKLYIVLITNSDHKLIKNYSKIQIINLAKFL